MSLGVLMKVLGGTSISIFLFEWSIFNEMYQEQYNWFIKLLVSKMVLFTMKLCGEK